MRGHDSLPGGQMLRRRRALLTGIPETQLCVSSIQLLVPHFVNPSRHLNEHSGSHPVGSQLPEVVG
jgi:hypothetical protein